MILEELPILIVVVLVVGAQALSKRFLYVKKLRAAENLGFIDTILTDKIGTLTENWLLWHSAHLGTEQYKTRSRSMAFCRDLDCAGLEKVLEAWLFMSGIGDDVEDVTTAARAQHPLRDGLIGEDNDVKVTVNHSSERKDSDDEAADSSPHNVDTGRFDRVVLFALGSNISVLGGPSGYGLLASNPDIKHYLERVYKTKTVAKFLEETPFDRTSKYSSQTFEVNSDLLKSRSIGDSLNPSAEVQVIYMKGAPELLLKHCSYALENGKVVPIGTIHGQIQEQVLKAASQGHRLIGYAYHYINSSSNKPLHDESKASIPQSSLEGGTFLGFFSFLDKVRNEASASVLECQQAGVRVIMVIGDHTKTAIAVGQEAGIISARQGSKPSESFRARLKVSRKGFSSAN